ncbi:DUF1016 N-terminal domain-containing protein [Methanolacinia paynteri]|uniref:DUF1016 N-terminal domain-containing protein n=1 Tax=Methanolacinia paynteri TaxID=230356 RepID=UPI000A059714
MRKVRSFMTGSIEISRNLRYDRKTRNTARGLRHFAYRGELQKDFPGISGFSASNLWRMKNFYETYRGSEKLAPLVREIGWSHSLLWRDAGTT